MVFILITVALDAIGIGLLIPILPKLIAELTGHGLIRAAVYGGWITALFATMQFLAAPVLGNLSDAYGRRPVLLLSLTAFGVNYLLLAFSSSIGWLFLAQALAGMCSATAATAGAYLADISKPEQRARSFGAMGGAFSFGLVIGPAMGGVLGGINLRLPIFVAAGLALLNVTYGYFVLPESHHRQNRRRFSFARAHIVGAFLQMRRVPVVFGMLGGMLLIMIASQTLPATWPYFTMQEFGWSERDVGYSLAAYGILGVGAQGLFVPWVNRRYGARRALLTGVCCAITGYLGFALAGSSAVLAAFVVPSALGFMAGPSLNSLMSGQLPLQQQGELQGAVAAVTSLAAIVTPLFMPWVFNRFASPGAVIFFPGAAYLLAALLALVALLRLRHVTGSVR
jgi:DHA1 family tetracycline resistance protein-like MFS transporter